MTMTYGQLESSLQAAIAATVPDDGDHYVYVCDFSDTFVIYCLNWDEYLQDDYTIDDDGNVSLAGSPIAVKPLTTYVPTEAEAAARVAFEQRGIVTTQTRSGRTPVRETNIRIKSEPLTYRQDSRSSWFQDFILTSLNRDAPKGAHERLASHNVEMRTINEERQARALSELRAGGFEYRVEPNTTPGTGGNFTPPLWANEFFATAKRPMRKLSDLIPMHFPCPSGVSSINLPIITQGSAVQTQIPNSAVADQDITDAVGSSLVVTFAGMADCALQLLEQSPPGAHVDSAFMMDLGESYDSQLEAQLIAGLGTAYGQLLGVTNVSNIVGVGYDSDSPTGSELYPFLGQAFAKVGNNRDAQPEVWLMRSARWGWLSTSESTADLPFGLPSLPIFLGSDSGTPNPISGLLGLPVFLDEAIPATLGAGGNEDEIILLRPSDLILFEGNPSITVGNVYTDVLSGALGVRIQMHDYAAAITNRYPSGISPITGTGMVVDSDFA